MKKIICVCLIFCLVFALSSCKATENKTPTDKTDSTTKTISGKMRLLYSASDTFNPYTATTDLNRKLCTLLFDSLTRLNNNFEAENLLAESVETKENACTVKIKNATFTDGSPVTADDVVYSYNLAKNSETDYGYQLYEVVSVSAADSKTVIFNLSRYDRYFERLIDFPILKSGSDTKVDVDGKSITPIGSGRYNLDLEKEKLTANKSHINGSLNIKEISLVNAPDGEAISHYVEIGATDLYYTDIPDANIIRMSGKKSTINLGNMVYIGINQSYGQLSSPILRHAISSAINRNDICKDAYYNNAVAATGFYNPAVKELQSVQNLQTDALPQISIENLEEIGYNNLDSEGIRVNSSGNRLSFTLMVNRENPTRTAAAKLIAEQLLSVGIKITVLEYTFEQYTEALNSGGFQLYLGEIKTLANGDLSALTTEGGSCAFGVVETKDASLPETQIETAEVQESQAKKDVLMSEIFDGFFSASTAITDVAVALQTRLPVIPVCFGQGLLFQSNNLDNTGESSQSDIYLSIGGYTLKDPKK